MSELNLNANSIYPKVIRIGYEGENVVTQINFNLQMWIDEYGLGGVTLLVLRHGDRDAYPVPLMIEDGIASWVITKTDTTKVGRGAIQLKYVVGEKIKKSPVFDISCLGALDDSDTVPDPYDSWLETLTDLAEQTTANAQVASAAASTATDKATLASQKAAASESASLATAKANAAATSETNAVTAAQTATTKASEAQASATSAQEYDESAQQSAVNAQTSATNAAASEAQAQHYAENASAYLMTDTEATNLFDIAKGVV